MTNQEREKLPILQEQQKQHSLFPLRYPASFDLYKKAESQIWNAQETDLSKDKFDKLPAEVQKYVKNLLAFFAISDGIVNDNLALNFLKEVKPNDLTYYYGLQYQIEQVHAEQYSLLIDAYVKNEDEKNEMFFAIENIPTVAKKAEWAQKWVSSESFVERLVAFACVEGLSFQSTFAGIFWLRTNYSELVEGLLSANTFIMRDENSHAEYALHIYNTYVKPYMALSDDRIKEIVLSCLDVEKSFVEDSLGNGFNGLTAELMNTYLEYVADTILDNFGIPPHFGSPMCLPFMTNLALKRKTNFFEKRHGEYTAPTDTTISFDSDF